MTNFDYLKSEKEFESFVNIAITAEKVFNIDIGTCVFNCRRALEMAIKWMYSVDNDLEVPYQDSLYSLMHTDEFRDIIGVDLWRRLDLIRRYGNDAAHTSNKISENAAKLCLKNLFYFTDFIACCYGKSYQAKEYDESLLTNQESKNIEIEEKEIKLSNFSKKSFDKVLAILNKKTLDKEEIKSSLKKEIFNIPKEDILEEHMRLLKKYVILATGVAIILSSGLYFLVKKNSGGKEMAPLLGIMILFNILMFGIPGIAIFYEYIKKGNEIPERIYVDIENINIDGKVYSMKEIKKIVATPASYEEGLIGKNFRKIIIHTNRNKKILHLGARAVAGINKIVYEEYNEPIF